MLETCEYISLKQKVLKLFFSFNQVLIPPKDLHEKLTEEGATRKVVMEQVSHRVEWEKHQERLRKKDEEERERERGIKAPLYYL